MATSGADSTEKLQKSDMTIARLVDMIATRELRLPVMQRAFVWQDTRVRDFFDSLYRGYPSGAILVWRAGDEQPAKDLAVTQVPSGLGTSMLLLDGQQRLTSLSAVLRGEGVEVRRKRKLHNIDILFNLEHPTHSDDVPEVEEGEDDEVIDDEDDDGGDEESLQERLQKLTFVVADRRLAASPTWVSVSAVMTSSDDSGFLRRAGVTSFDDPRFSKYTQRLQRLRAIRNYQYVVHVLDKDLEYEEVTEIFVRVNSLGVKLRSSDLAMAQITSRWRDLPPLLEEFQAEAEEHGFTLDLGLLVRAMVVFASGQSRFKSTRRISTPALQGGWEEAKEGIRFALNFLRANGGIEDETLLSSPFFILTAAYLYHKAEGVLSEQEVQELLEWILVGSARGYYSGSAETKLDADLDQIRRHGRTSALMERLEQQFGRRRFAVSDIAGRGVKSGLYASSFLALRRQGAKDWRTGLAISLTHSGNKHVIQAHHIFPKARLSGRFEKREINEIANLAFIGGTTNRQISAADPEKYLAKVVEKQGEDALRLQCVPLDPKLWRVDSYPEFLEARRAALIDSINDMLDAIAKK